MSDAVEFIDASSIHVQGGRGGNGAASFRREAHVPRGGPDGGDGGDGGAVILRADRSTASLLDVHRHPHRRGDDGGHGSSQRKSGKDGQDRVVIVPVGTEVRDRHGHRLVDLVRDGQEFVAAKGGRGGRGNAAFANRHRRVPGFAEYGEQVAQETLGLELKVIADVGLVGFPSAGKSSLITRLSAATPRIEAWPFTTLTPHLGVMRAGNTADGTPIDVILADVPGLVEGASDGRGLGHRFLRHIERCRVLLHVVDTSSLDPQRDPIRDLEVIRGELFAHEPSLADRTELVGLNKVDLPDGDAMAEIARDQLVERGFEVFDISALTGAGLDELRYRLGELVASARQHDVDLDRDEPVVVTLGDRGPDFEVGHDDSGRWAVVGARVQRWVQMLPLDNPEAVAYLQGRLRRAGVERALVDAGARAGDDVVVGDMVFAFEPDIDDLPAEEREAILAAELDDDDDDDLDGGPDGYGLDEVVGSELAGPGEVAADDPGSGSSGGRS